MSSYLIESISRDFDVADVVRCVRSIEFSAPDPHVEHVYVLAETSEFLHELIGQRRRGEFSMLAIRIGISTKEISLACATAQNAPARVRLDWLTANYRVKFTDDEFNPVSPDSDVWLAHLLSGPPGRKP